MGRLYYMRNAVGEAIACYEQVLPVAEAWGDDRLLAVASSAIGQAMLIQGYANRAEPLLSQAVSLFEEIGDWSEWIRAMGFHGVALVAKGGYAAGLAEILRARARAQEIGALSEIAMNDLILASAYTMGGDVSRALEVAHEAVEKAEQSGDRLYVYIGYLRYAWATCRAGQIDAAVANLAKAQAMADVLAGPLIYVHHLAALRAEIAFAAGEVEVALGLARRAVELAEAMDGIEGEGLARRVWGQALAGLVSSALPAPLSHLDTPRSRVREAAEASQWDEAEKQLATSLGLLLSGHLRLEAARTHLAWGTICRDRGDPDAARAHWAKAAAQFKESELPWESARLQTLIRSLDLGLSGES
jgi:tetratricopeptide (TPR) repeat protein